MKATLLIPTGEEKQITPKNKTNFSLEEVQKLVGGYVQLIHLNRREIMLVNEDGISKVLLPNAKASSMTGHHSIYGNALICKGSMFK